MELNLKEEEKDGFINFMLRQYRLVDALWFLAVEDKFGLDAAVELNEMVWEEMGARTAREIKKRFGIVENGLDGFVKALKYFPWAVIINYVVEKKGNRIIIKVPHCPPQEARLRSGRGEFPCKTMHFREFQYFAEEIDERIEVKCVFAPPDSHPKDQWCEWEFRIRE